MSEGFWQDKEISDLLKQGAHTIEVEKRAPFYQKAEQLVRDKVYRIYVANNPSPYAFSKKVTGFVPQPTDDEWFNTVSFVSQ